MRKGLNKIKHKIDCLFLKYINHTLSKGNNPKMTELKEISNTFYDLEQDFDYEAELEKEEEDMMEMWLEKLNRPGRLETRGGKEVTKEDLMKMFAEEREEAMAEIMAMTAKEFQTRIFDGTLPEFMREKNNGKLLRDTCHGRNILTEEQLNSNVMNYANFHRDKLRYMSAESYKELAYNLWNIHS
jgi:hypothetical protein